MVFLESHMSYIFEKTFGLEYVLSYHNELNFLGENLPKSKI
jgi:hypothetical protein